MTTLRHLCLSYSKPLKPRRFLGGCVAVAALTVAGCERSVTPLDPSPAAVMSADRAAAPSGPSASTSVYATGLNNPRGLRFGPDGSLYVAEAGAGGSNSTVGLCPQVPAPVGPYLGGTGAQITRISRSGVKSTFASGLPTSINGLGFVSGLSGLEFIGDDLYALVDGAGCSHGHLDLPNGILRINRDGSWRQIADLSAFYHAHPTAHPQPADFEPDGTPYSMVAVHGALYVVEPNQGSLDRVELNGRVRRVADITATQGHIVPTTVTYHGNFFVGNLNTFPVVPGSSRILQITPSGHVATRLTGFTAVLGSAWDERGRYYVLESSTVAGNPTPMTGRVRRVDPSGATTTIADGLFLPTAMTLGPDGNLYVSNVGFGPPPIGLGTIVKIDIH
jgi:hypothetical protein